MTVANALHAQVLFCFFQTMMLQQACFHMFSYHASRDMCGNTYRETQALRTKSSQCSRIWLCSRQAIESVRRHFRAIHPCPFWHCLATLLWNWHDSGPNGFCKGHSFGLQTGFTLDPLHPNSSKYLGPMMWDYIKYIPSTWHGL